MGGNAEVLCENACGVQRGLANACGVELEKTPALPFQCGAQLLHSGAGEAADFFEGAAVLFEFLAGFAEFSFRRQALVVVEFLDRAVY